ncbi:AAA family ATPase [Olivibacter sitiensis]|uniref:AAA family ATPase n=1 Tax=Olivibacter sitiensis TaxID=376470 RepID=UPI000482ACBB|nr:ATP-binding protein [Olivibacter sitiensis]
MERKPFLKIAVVGPESTGKSTVSQAVAQHFNTVAVPEYAREYCRNLNRKYTLQDEVNIFYGQLALERALVPFVNKGIMVCDTMFLTVKIWCDHLFGDTPNEVKAELNTHKYDFYLLMDIDLPWEDDPLRDFPEERPYFLEIWKRELEELGADYELISGIGPKRIEHALQSINLFFKRTGRR